MSFTKSPGESVPACQNHPVPTPDFPWRPGRPLQFGRDGDGVVRILREFLVRALEQEVVPSEATVVLRVRSPDGRRTAGLGL
jgi:hypothetical protein